MPNPANILYERDYNYTDVTFRDRKGRACSTRDEKHLNIRAFTQAMKIKVYEKQGGICPICGKHFELKEMEADHITPWSEGGKTDENNC